MRLRFQALDPDAFSAGGYQQCRCVLGHGTARSNPGFANPPGVADGDVEAVTLYPVPAVAAVDIGAGNRRFGQAGHLLDLSGKAVAVMGITWQSHGPEGEPAALAALVCGGDGGLAAELVAGAGLALSPSRRCDASTAGQWMHSTSGAWKA